MLWGMQAMDDYIRLDRIPNDELRDDDYEYLESACKEALNSRDPSTQNGALIVNHNVGTWVLSFNDIPSGLGDTPERRTRPWKYYYTEHAERSAISTAAKYGIRTQDATLYVPWFACIDCARAIIESGITQVIGSVQLFRLTPERWQESCRIGLEMLHEAKVRCLWLDTDFGITLRFDGQEVRL